MALLPCFSYRPDADFYQTLGPELVKIIMLTLPYAIASSSTDLQSKAADLLLKTEIIASAPRETETIVDPYIRVEGAAAPEPLSYLIMLQRQLQSEANMQWPLKVIPRLFEPLKQEEEDLIEMGERGTAGIKHALPAMAIPETNNPSPEPIFPELYLSVYADQEIEVRTLDGFAEFRLLTFIVDCPGQSRYCLISHAGCLGRHD